jgi:hypothetical protein
MIPERPNFISEAAVLEHTKVLLAAVGRAKSKIEKNPFRNVVDPFSAVVDGLTQGLCADQWMGQEVARQLQKSLQNAIGEFHQSIIGCLPGWKSAGRGGSYDVVHQERNLIAEVKSKYNTMNSASALATYDNLSRHLDYREQKGGIAYLVEILPKRRERYCFPFVASEKNVQRPERSDLLRIDGASFFDVATGEADSLRRFYLYWSWLLEAQLEFEESNPGIRSGYELLFERVFPSS